MRRAAPLSAPAGVDRCHALLHYDGAARELVARLKYRNARASITWLARAMAALIEGPVDVVTFVPTTPRRRRQRGFDQAQLLAEAVARELRVPTRRLLVRSAGAPQTGADAATRRTAHIAVHARSVNGTVLLVDDVITTGATISASARALRAAGAQHVVALVAARTPAPGALH
jgi:ComF family protein